MYPATTMWKTMLRLPQPLSNTFLSLFFEDYICLSNITLRQADVLSP